MSSSPYIKLAIDPMRAALYGSIVGQALGQSLHLPLSADRKSLMELYRQKRLDSARTPEEREQRQKQLETAGVSAEMGPATLATAPLPIAGFAAAGRIAKSVKPSGAKVPASAFQRAMGTDVAGYSVSPSEWSRSVAIPKGGALPSIGRPLERMFYERAGIPEKVVEEGWKRGVVIAPKSSPEFLAHELGHQALRKNLVARGLLRWLRPGAPIAGAITAATMMAKSDADSTTNKLAPAVAAAGMVPMLADEALASRLAMKTIRESGRYTPEAVALMRKNLLKAFGTYGAVSLAGLLPIAAAAYSRPYVAKWRAKAREKTSGVRDIPSILSGSRARDIEQYYAKKILSSPVVKNWAKKTSVPIHRDYVSDYLRGKTKSYWKPVEMRRMSGEHKNIYRQLEEGRKKVTSEDRKTAIGRLAVASLFAAPIAAHEFTKENAKKSKTNYKALAAGAVAGSLPLAQSGYSGAIRVNSKIPKTITSHKAFTKMLKPGDILLSGIPGRLDPTKAGVSIIGGDPKGYHAEIVGGRIGKNRWSIHSHPLVGGAGYGKPAARNEYNILLRLKNDSTRSKAKKFVSNALKKVTQQELLEKSFGPSARGSRYDEARSIYRGATSLLPESVAQLVRKKPKAGTGFCTSIVGEASPVKLVKGVHPSDVMPHHLLHSKALKPVAQYIPKSLGKPAMFADRLLAASPFVLKGALGFGLGYGAYRGVKAVTDK